MSFKKGQMPGPAGYGSTGHPVSDRKTISPEACTTFLRGVAQLLLLGAEHVESQKRLPEQNELQYIEGEWKEVKG